MNLEEQNQVNIGDTIVLVKTPSDWPVGPPKPHTPLLCKVVDTDRNSSYGLELDIAGLNWWPKGDDMELPNSKPVRITKTQRRIKATEELLINLKELDKKELSLKSKQGDIKAIKLEINELKEKIGE